MIEYFIDRVYHFIPYEFDYIITDTGYIELKFIKLNLEIKLPTNSLNNYETIYDMVEFLLLLCYKCELEQKEQS